MKITVPKKALRLPAGMMAAVDGKEEDSVTPEVNDPVSFNVEGVVTSVNGENAEVEVRFVNGERPEAEAKSKENKADEEMSDDDLAAMAEKADAGEEY